VCVNFGVHGPLSNLALCSIVESHIYLTGCKLKCTDRIHSTASLSFSLSLSLSLSLPLSPSLPVCLSLVMMCVHVSLSVCVGMQASRGNEIDDGITAVDSSDEKKTLHIPLEADQLVVHSTSEGTATEILHLVWYFCSYNQIDTCHELYSLNIQGAAEKSSPLKFFVVFSATV